jgi:AcrR family transcriptional regulator
MHHCSGLRRDGNDSFSAHIATWLGVRCLLYHETVRSDCYQSWKACLRNEIMGVTEGRRDSDERRSRQKRARILQAAVDCLIDMGYAAASIGAIQARAGVSRGALLHHYPTKADLLVDALRHLSDQQLEQFTLATAAEGGAADWLDTLWQSFETPLFGALLELWVAARTDDELRQALLVHQRDLHHKIRAVFLALFGGDPPIGFDSAFESTLIFYRGLALTGVLSDKRRARALSEWGVVVRQILNAGTALQAAARSDGPAEHPALTVEPGP